MGEDDGVTNAGFEETDLDCELGAVSGQEFHIWEFRVNKAEKHI